MKVKNILERINTLAGGRLVGMAVLFCYVVAAFYFLLVGLMLWRGDVWAYIIYAENPYAHVAGGLFFLLLAHILKVGDRYTSRDWKLLAAKCVMLCFSMGIAWLIGEIGLRFILKKQQESASIERLREMKAKNKKIPIKSDHPMAAIIELSANVKLVFELQPNINMDFGHKSLRTNSKGMRSDNEYAIERTAGTCRIIGIGDSGMFGWNVNQGEEYMAVLERNLNQRGDGVRYEVLNMGVPGYNTALEVEGFTYKGLQFDPDIVVVGWCVNDYQLPFFMLEVENFKRTDVSFLHTYLFKRAMVADVVAGRKLRSYRDANRSMVDDDIKINAGMDGVKRALMKLKVLSVTESFHLIVMGPLKKEILDILDELEIDRFNIYDKIDASQYPPEYEVYFMHPGPGGHAVIAEKLEANLAERGWLCDRESVPNMD